MMGEQKIVENRYVVRIGPNVISLRHVDAIWVPGLSSNEGPERIIFYMRATRTVQRVEWAIQAKELQKAHAALAVLLAEQFIIFGDWMVRRNAVISAELDNDPTRRSLVRMDGGEAEQYALQLDPESVKHLKEQLKDLREIQPNEGGFLML